MQEAPIEPGWNLESAELAYSVISRYVEHTQVSALVIALLANSLGEERLKPLVESEYWQAYQESKRLLAEARRDIDGLTRLIDQMRETERSSLDK
jgi:hypothetical protein